MPDRAHNPNTELARPRSRRRRRQAAHSRPRLERLQNGCAIRTRSPHADAVVTARSPSHVHDPARRNGATPEPARGTSAACACHDAPARSHPGARVGRGRAGVGVGARGRVRVA
eukprot:2179039-Pleurochrysis_carterae.AAC.5